MPDFREDRRAGREMDAWMTMFMAIKAALEMPTFVWAGRTGCGLPPSVLDKR